MAGHSKWAKVKHRKAITDARKSKIFSKLVRYVQVEAKKARGDKNAPNLRAAIEKARAANMPRDVIERAISKASADGAQLEAVTYEAYGPGGAALVIEGYSDNRNRTSAEIKHLLSTNGGSLAAPGAAMWAFTKGPEGLAPATTVELGEEDLEKLAQLVDEVEEHDDINDVYTNAA